MAFLDFVAEKESNNQHEKFYGNYRGIVVDNNDELKNGRCKINVFGVYDELRESDLPWATFADPFMGGLQGYGSSLIPEVDTHVWVFFEGGDVRFPVYFAGAPAMNGEDNPDLPEESATDYPDNKVIRLKSGFTVEMNQKEGNETLRIFHPAGWEMIVSPDGSQVTDIPVTLTINTADRITLNCPLIDLGEDSSLEPSVLGDKLASWISTELKTYLDLHQHIGNLGAPTSPAMNGPFGPFIEGSGASGGAVYSKKNRNQ